MIRNLLGVLVDVENEEAKAIEIGGTLDGFYKALNCDTIDIVVRKIGRKHFNIVCDDEGFFKDEPKISAIDNMGDVMFVGNLFIVSGQVDSEGNLVSLTNEETEYIMKRVQKMYTRNFPNGYPMLTQCEY